MQFIITPIIDGKESRLYVNFIRKTDSLEYYQVSCCNRETILSCNRPLIQSKQLKRFQITWRVEEGEMRNIALEKITQAIEWSWQQI